MTPQPSEQPLHSPMGRIALNAIRWRSGQPNIACAMLEGDVRWLLRYLDEAEAAAPDPVASPPEAVRLLRELVDRWFLYSDDLPKADVMDRLARLDAFHASADEARRYLASATEGETAE